MNDLICAVEAGLNAGAMLDAEQLVWLYMLAAMAPDGPTCEVGVYTGGSIICWAQVRRERGAIFAVDAFGPESKWARAYDTYRYNIMRAGLDQTIMLVREKSYEATPYVPDGLAFLFIDARHDLLGIPRDIVVWPQKMMPGGVIVYHDYVSSKKTAVVGCCVDAWQAEVNWIDLGMVGSARAFLRPPE